MGRRKPKTPQETVAANIRAYRDGAGLSRRELAERCERKFAINEQTIYRLEERGGWPNSDQIQALADALELHWTQFYTVD